MKIISQTENRGLSPIIICTYVSPINKKTGANAPVFRPTELCLLGRDLIDRGGSTDLVTDYK